MLYLFSGNNRYIINSISDIMSGDVISVVDISNYTKLVPMLYEHANNICCKLILLEYNKLLFKSNLYQARNEIYDYIANRLLNI